MSRRMERVNELLRERLSDLLLRHVSDPRLRGVISVTSVDTAPDFSFAKVYISVLGTAEDAETALEGFRAASRYLRRSLAAEIALRRMPELVFLGDDSIREGTKVLSLLRQVRKSERADS